MGLPNQHEVGGGKGDSSTSNSCFEGKFEQEGTNQSVPFTISRRLRFVVKSP